MIFSLSALILAIFFLDQLSKFLILKYLNLHKIYQIIPHFFSITPTMNTGGGFGILPKRAAFFILISSATIIFLAYILLKQKIKNRFISYSVAMILAGASGNLCDRLRFGAVVDFLDFKIWPVFNVADSFISIAVMILVWELLRGPPEADPPKR